MPKVIFAPAAIRDLERLRAFLRTNNPSAAKRAGQAIVQGLLTLAAHPRLGKPVEDMPVDYRDWLIGFGRSGYVARYRIDSDAVIVLALRHQREAGFRSDVREP